LDAGLLLVVHGKFAAKPRQGANAGLRNRPPATLCGKYGLIGDSTMTLSGADESAFDRVVQQAALLAVLLK
jgi:hypothetical protein